MSDDMCDRFRSESHFSDLAVSQSICPCSTSNIQETLQGVVSTGTVISSNMRARYNLVWVLIELSLFENMLSLTESRKQGRQ